MITTTPATGWDCPLTDSITRLQDDGHEVWIIGWSADWRKALVRSGAGYSIASRHTCNGLGRWECPADRPLPDRYYESFPNR